MIFKWSKFGRHVIKSSHNVYSTIMSFAEGKMVYIAIFFTGVTALFIMKLCHSCNVLSLPRVTEF